MEELIVEINDTKYLLVDELVVGTGDKLKKKIKKFDCIFQGIKDVNDGGFWNKAHAVVTVLVPLDKIMEYNNSEL